MQHIRLQLHSLRLPEEPWVSIVATISSDDTNPLDEIVSYQVLPVFRRRRLIIISQPLPLLSHRDSTQLQHTRCVFKICTSTSEEKKRCRSVGSYPGLIIWPNVFHLADFMFHLPITFGIYFTLGYSSVVHY